jgi:hypothetical protein
MDACVDSGHPDSMDLIREIINSGYKGPIISNSTSMDYDEYLVRAGATHRSSGKGKEAAELALQLLNQ